VLRVPGIIAAVSAGLDILKAAKGTRSRAPRHGVEEDEEMFI
jgi:hypothetical protein